MKISLNQFSDQEKKLHFSKNEEWVLKTILDADESDPNDPRNLRPKGLNSQEKNRENREISFDVSLRRIDRIYEVTGKVRTSLHLLCSRCARDLNYEIRADFTNLYTKDAAMAGAFPPGTEGAAGTTGRTLNQQNFLDIDENIDITYLTEETIDLREVLAEQVHLQVPYQPLCDPGSICDEDGPKFGPQWNRLQEASAKRNRTSSAFASLKNLRPKLKPKQ